MLGKILSICNTSRTTVDLDLRHSQSGFYVKSVQSPFPELHAKAYNARVVTAWLSDFVCGLQRDSNDSYPAPDLALVVSCVCL